MVSSFVQWSFYMTVSADPVVAMQLMGLLCSSLSSDPIWYEEDQKDGFSREGQRPIAVAHGHASRNLESEWYPSSP